MKATTRSLARWLSVVTTAALVVLAPIGVTARAEASDTMQGKVRIYLVGTLTIGPECVRVAEGRFRLVGALSDRGTFVTRFLGCHTPLRRYERTLYGRRGSITVLGHGPSWRVVRGTRAYAGIVGRGSQEGRLAHLGRFEGTMTGTVRR